MLDLVALYLRPHEYQCKKASGAREALAYLKEENIDIVLLDIMMPEMNGWELCKEIRLFSDVPIIMLTARQQQEDIIKGLNLGADDYITKPFDEKELLARMGAVLRRRTSVNFIEVNGLIWEGDRFELSFKKEPIKLTPKEYAMIGLLMGNPDRVFAREQLIDLIWGYNSKTEGRTVDSHVRNVREKIREVGFPIDEHFITVWGIGYKWTNMPKL
jgi:DNA-binding response OmpR family regulator